VVVPGDGGEAPVASEVRGVLIWQRGVDGVPFSARRERGYGGLWWRW
jgi:hypothetical protein